MGRQLNLEYPQIKKAVMEEIARLRVAPVTVTALATGSLPGTAKIPAGARVVNAVCDTATKAIVLPDPIVGDEILIIKAGTTGMELRSSSPTTVAINGGTGAAAESAVAGGVKLLHCVCVSATAWIVNSRTASAAGNVMLEAAA